MQMFDLLAGAILLVSGVTGLVRGAAHQVGRVLALIVAAAVALYGLRVTGPVMRDVINPDWAGTAAAGLGVYALVYLLLRLIGAGFERRLHSNAALGALDRVVGAGFGLIRAMVILGAFSLLLDLAAAPGAPPAWVTRGALYPLTEASGRILRVFAPRVGELGEHLAPAVTTNVRQGATSDPKEGYSDDERRRLDDLVDTAR
jgi:membrane protein required for colicin V production